MKILELRAENIKKLKVVTIKPDGSVVQITGPNMSGKSSVLDSIYWALAGTKEISSKPIRKGEDKAMIRLDLGEVRVIRRFTPSGTTLVVEAANGARFPSPQRMLDDLLGAFTFDPLAFTKLEGANQLEALRKLVKLEVDIDALDGQNKTDFETRTEINRALKSLQAQADAISFLPGTPEQEIDTSALALELESAGEWNAEIERRKARRDKAADDIKAQHADVIRIRAEAADLRRRAVELASQAEAKDGIAQSTFEAAQELQKRLDEAQALPEPKITSEIRDRMYAANATNNEVRMRARKSALLEQLKIKQAEADALTERMDGRSTLRAKTIAEAKMPVPGLSFGNGEILYNDLPLDQASSAEQLRVSVSIAMALNPKLRVLRIKDGSLLDNAAFAILGEMAEANDYQVWVERVDETGKVGIVMEDGEVKAAEPEVEDDGAE